MKIGLVQYDGEEVLVNWGSASYAEPDGNGGSLIHFRGDNAVLKVTCSVREIYALLEEAEQKQAELQRAEFKLEIVHESCGYRGRGLNADGSQDGMPNRVSGVGGGGAGGPGKPNYASGGQGGGGAVSQSYPSDKSKESGDV